MTTRVAIIANEWPPFTGGCGTALKSMIEATEDLRDEYDVKITVVIPGETRLIWWHVIAHRASLLSLGVGKTAAYHGLWIPAKLRLIQALSRLSIEADVYHLWYAIPSVWFAHKPFIVTLHGGDVPGRWPRYKYVWPIIGRSYRKQCNKAEAITAVTPKLCAMASKFLGREVLHTPNGVKVPLDVARTIPHNPLRLLAVTRIAPLKNVHELVQVASMMPNAILRIVGDGEDMPKYRNCGVKNIEWVGWQEDLDPHYRWADIFINATSATGMSCTMLEAKSYRLPIVAKRFPNISNYSGVYSAVAPWQYIYNLRYIEKYYTATLVAATEGIENLSWDVRAREYFELYKKIAKGTL